MFKLRLILPLFIAVSFLPAFGDGLQTTADKELAYTKTINERADNIVSTLGITDAGKAAQVQEIVAQQYRSLREIHDARDARLSEIKRNAPAGGESAGEQTKAVQDEATAKLNKLHQEYLARLSAELTPEQVDKVKDGMTYGVLPVTYGAYLQMLPGLTGEQKKQILAWLMEARENAMDAGSSKEKHAWFGKYKGRINNYLSAAGIDMKEAGQNLKSNASANSSPSAATD